MLVPRLLLAVALTVTAVTTVTPPASAASGSSMHERPPYAGAPRLPSAPAARLCSGHAAEYGDWANADPATTGVTRAHLRDCQAVTTCSGDACSVTYDAGWALRLFGSCHPADCDWGWTAGSFRLTNGQIPGFYDQGFARRSVWAAMSSYRPGQLWIAIRTDFTDPARADYDSQNWFVRA